MAMYGFGWRKRIGCISPSVMEMISFDFYRFAPEGIGFVGVTDKTNTWSPEDVETALNGALDSAAYLGDRGCDYVVHTGAAHIASKGKGYDRAFLDEMRRRSGVPGTTSIRSALRGFKRMGMRRIAVASPWPEKITGWVVDYIRAEGIEPVHVATLGTDFKVLHTLEPSAIYRFATGVMAASGDADGLYMPGPQAPVAMTVAAIERDIGRPVVASTPADFWAAFNDLGIRDRIEGHGRLLASLCEDGERA
jgi:maleate cis-trans isomerase